MTREEKKELILGFQNYKFKELQHYSETDVDLFLNSLEMTKEKAIEWLQFNMDELEPDNDVTKKVVQALQFAINYINQEGEIIGYVNYYPTMESKWGEIYDTEQEAITFARSDVKSIVVPIRHPNI